MALLIRPFAHGINKAPLAPRASMAISAMGRSICRFSLPATAATRVSVSNRVQSEARSSVTTLSLVNGKDIATPQIESGKAVESNCTNCNHQIDELSNSMKRLTISGKKLCQLHENSSIIQRSLLKILPDSLSTKIIRFVGRLVSNETDKFIDESVLPPLPSEWDKNSQLPKAIFITSEPDEYITSFQFASEVRTSFHTIEKVVSTKHEMLWALYYCAVEKPQLIVITAHGSRKTMEMDNDDPVGKSDIRRWADYLKYLPANTTILLQSCSTGKWGDKLGNIANWLAHHAPQVKIIAPREDVRPRYTQISNLNTLDIRLKDRRKPTSIFEWAALKYKTAEYLLSHPKTPYERAFTIVAEQMRLTKDITYVPGEHQLSRGVFSGDRADAVLKWIEKRTI